MRRVVDEETGALLAELSDDLGAVTTRHDEETGALLDGWYAAGAPLMGGRVEGESIVDRVASRAQPGEAWWQLALEEALGNRGMRLE